MLDPGFWILDKINLTNPVLNRQYPASFGYEKERLMLFPIIILPSIILPCITPPHIQSKPRKTFVKEF